ncbi:initiator tRNA phosphoribosyl transferase-domain-containing protein [Lophiotrema nucula]|uniref:Initiator tRNA phosphoribosyl transferase-domain-containing protein n=1 Tax=Lophiotrema nucula TaxID=690887 RepID=A0A6A5Z770_9PLEO|nr:initiator tRNA phosphoribosyl transferase-domain-containing protein [Lophiotrema nucula]
MARTLTQADLIFPIQAQSFSSTLSSLKRSALSISNRLTSITQDSIFVQSVADAYDLPLVANERCGSWYIPPEKKAESAYFKSTDGHVNEWSFNLRRLNLHILDLVARDGGCVIVDSTRRGKSMPDALSKTIPIWCCVINRAIFPDVGDHELHTPGQTISASEHAQIEQRIEGFVKDFVAICKPDIPSFRQKLKKPLRPLWVTQSSSLPDLAPEFLDFFPAVLCTASRRVHGVEGSEGGYIQGAADDHEAWACGLTPTLFWNNRDLLLASNEDDLPAIIAGLVEDETSSEAIPILIRPTTKLFVCSSENADLKSFDTVISCTPEPLTTTNPKQVRMKKYLHLKCREGKLGSRDLRPQLTHLPAFFEAVPDEVGNILICCPTGKDLSVGVALLLLCLYADDNGRLSNRRNGRKVDKTFIKQRLTWITTSSPFLNPSRTTLTSVNEFLMPSPMAMKKMPSLPTPITKLTLLGDAPTSEVAGEVAVSQDQQLHERNMPSRIFASLLNNTNPWTFTRTLSSALPTHPSGTVTGIATFTPLTSPSHIPSKAAYLYAEEGEFVTNNGLRFTARRKYVYFLKKDSDDEEEYISVYFHEEDKEDGIEGMFVEMGELSGEKKGRGEWVAKNREQHLCGEDLYTASWRFGGAMGRGGEVEDERWWEVRYDVKGPKKDYVSETRYAK